MQTADFWNQHKGQTCLIVGVGPNLSLTPPEWFDYPSFGVNTIYHYEGWKPTYYVGVDERLRLEDGAAICEKYAEIPKFFPRPDWDALEGPNICRFLHRTGAPLIGGWLPTHQQALEVRGIQYWRIMDAVMQIAAWMGFETMLMIGVQHKPDTGGSQDRAHFWGMDWKAHAGQPVTWWFEGYRLFSNAVLPARVLNISADTYVPEDVLPRDDWRKWANHAPANHIQE